LPVELDASRLPWQIGDFDSFLLANQFVVRGLSVRNRHDGIGAPLIAVMKKEDRSGLKRSSAVTAFLRIDGSLADLDQGRCRARLECYSGYSTNAVAIGKQIVPLEADTTAPMAYALNQQMVRELKSFTSSLRKKSAPSNVLPQPFESGKSRWCSSTYVQQSGLVGRGQYAAGGRRVKHFQFCISFTIR
jgi:hypothetical protein